MPLERLAAPRRDLPRDVKQRPGVEADFLLRVRVEPEFQKVKEVVQVYLPIPFGINRERQVDPREFPGDAALHKPHVIGVGAALPGLKPRADFRRPRRLDGFRRPSLFVVVALERHIVRVRHIEIVLHHRIAPGNFVDPRRAVADPLPRHEHGQFHMEGENHLLERARVPVPEEVINQRRVLAVTLRALAVGNPRRLNHPLVAAEIVHQPHEPLVKHRKNLVQNSLGLRSRAMRHVPPPA
ncbi:MAG: hypothetical protein MdMp014T_0966 [Treponematales bacterium]